jgi:hypothetical protein
MQLEPQGINPWTCKALLEEWMTGVVEYMVEMFTPAARLKSLSVRFAVEAYEDLYALREQVRKLDQIKGIERVEVVVESRMGADAFTRVLPMEHAFPRLELARIGEGWEDIGSEMVVLGDKEDDDRERKYFEW